LVVIAEQIKKSLDAVQSWNSVYTSFLGIAFGKTDTSTLDSVIDAEAKAGRWVNVAKLKTEAEIIRYDSPTIQDAVKQMLTNMPMFNTTKLPKNGDDGRYWNWYYCVLNGYRWARELNHETSKWGDPADGFRGLYSVRVKEPAVFYACNPDTGEVLRMFGGRWHQAAALMGNWMKFHEYRISDAEVALTNEQMNFIQTYWKTDHFIYAPQWQNYEVRNDMVFTECAKLTAGYPLLADVTGYVTRDLSNRYTRNKWGSPQWGGYNVAVHHYPDNLERRMDGTIGAWSILHMYYKLMSDADKANLREMLLGSKETGRAADLLLASDLFDSSTQKFRVRSGDSPSDLATCFGCVTLFLMGIIPESGSLAVPIRALGTEAYPIEFFDPIHFGFNYDARRIKVPVYAGKMLFQFGDKPAEAKFQFDGIYQVQFSNDWNNVLSVQKVADLNALYLITPKKPTTVEALTSSFAVMLTAFPIWSVSKQLIRQVKR
jgi:hypothetical protein